MSLSNHNLNSYGFILKSIGWLLIFCWVINYFTTTLDQPLQNGFPLYVTPPNWDFGVFYFGNKLFCLGENPHIFQIIMRWPWQEVQDAPVYFISPPWIHVALSPWFYLTNYKSSVTLWAISYPLMYFGSFYLLLNESKTNQNILRNPLTWITIIMFLPFQRQLVDGNLAPLILFSVTLAYLLFNRGNQLLAGFFLFPVLIKPQLLAISLPVFCYYSIKNSKFDSAIGFIVTTACFSLCLEYVHPGTFYEWFNSFKIIKEHATPVFGANLTSLLVWLAPTNLNHKPTLAVISLLVGIMSVIIFSKKANTYETLIFSVIVSPFFSPYSWLHDYQIGGVLCIMYLLKCTTIFQQRILATINFLILPFYFIFGNFFPNYLAFIGQAYALLLIITYCIIVLKTTNPIHQLPTIKPN